MGMHSWALMVVCKPSDSLSAQVKAEVRAAIRPRFRAVTLGLLVRRGPEPTCRTRSPRAMIEARPSAHQLEAGPD